MATKIEHQLDTKPLEISSKALGCLADAIQSAKIKFLTRN